MRRGASARWKIAMAWIVIAAAPAVAGAAGTSRPALDTARIEQLTGAKGKLDEKEGVFKVSVPRTDLSVTAAGVKILTAMGLTSWAAFEGAPSEATVMGDLVLTQSQVNPVMSAALDGGLEVTALHNHFFWDTPHVMFMHIGGMGSEQELATAVGKVFAKIKETAATEAAGTGSALEPPTAGIDPARTSIDGTKIDAILGVKGKMDGGVFKTTIGRTTRMHGMQAGNEGERQGVLKALRAALDRTATKLGTR